MKISKLFHWLYAFLMLMPVFFIGGRVLYTVFNKNAKDSYSGETIFEINYKYQSNEVYNESDLHTLNIYHINGYIEQSLMAQYPHGYFEFSIISGDVILDNFSLDAAEIDDGYLNNSIIYRLDSNISYYNAFEYEIDYDTITFDDAIIRYYGSYDFRDYISLLSYTTYNEIESVDIDTSGTLDNAFSYSVSQLNENALFSWAKDSFLVTPFAYITGLFGLEATSPINTLLSYWLSISIIWLVFDLVMYLPLLFHRWLDKGVLE